MRSSPSIGLNALALRPGGSGVQTYIRELLRQLSPLVSAAGGSLVAAVQADAVAELPAGVEAVQRPPSSGLRRAIAGLRSVGFTDLLHALDVDLPLRTRVPTVATIHDLSVFDVPSMFSRQRVLGERLLVTHAVHRADVLVAVSRFTADRLRARFGRDSVVTPLAPSPDLKPPQMQDVEEVRVRYQLPPRFVLHVGTVEPRKNVAMLEEACERVGVPLVLAGAVPGQRPSGAATLVLGYVPRRDLPALFVAATVVGYASLYEGFGLPPLEAMACGAVTVATRVGSLSEVLGDGAEMVRPGDVEALAIVLRRLIRDDQHRSALARAGLARARRFTWEATAESTIAVYRSLGLQL